MSVGDQGSILLPDFLEREETDDFSRFCSFRCRSCCVGVWRCWCAVVVVCDGVGVVCGGVGVWWLGCDGVGVCWCVVVVCGLGVCWCVLVLVCCGVGVGVWSWCCVLVLEGDSTSPTKLVGQTLG